MVQPEAKLKKDIKELVKSRGGYIVPIPGGRYGVPGAPDLVACYKGFFIAIEGKTYDGVQSELQKRHERMINGAGGIYVLARAREHVERVLDDIDEIGGPE